MDDIIDEKDGLDRRMAMGLLLALGGLAASGSAEAGGHVGRRKPPPPVVKDELYREIEAVLELAERLGTRDVERLAVERYGTEDPMLLLSGGEFSHRCMIRSILEPVRRLPAEIP